MPNTRYRESPRDRNFSGRNTMMAAPTMGPANPPMPPITTMARMITEEISEPNSLNESGLMNPTHDA